MKKKLNIILFILLILLLTFCENVNLGEYFYVYEHGENPQWMPNGSKIAFICRSYYYTPKNQYTGDTICLIDDNGNDFYAFNMSENNLYIRSFSISKDNRFICFDGSKYCNGKMDEINLPKLYLFSIEYEKTELLFFDNEFDNLSPTWSPDCEWIYFTRSDGWPNPSTIWKIKPDGTELTKLDIEIGKFISMIKCSNNGNYLLLEYYDGNNYKLMVSSIDGKNRWSIADEFDYDCEDPCFSPDDKFICFGHGANLFIVPFDNSKEPVRITDYKGPNIGFFSPNWSTDGAWIVCCLDDFLYKIKVPNEFMLK